MQPLVISIATPCHAKWDAMNTSQNGRFCLSCQKEVVDFTNKTDDEVFNFFKNHQSGSCIRIESNRLDAPIIASKPKFVWQWKRPVFAAFMWASLTVAMPSCMMGPPDGPSAAELEQQMEDSIKQAKQTQTHTINQKTIKTPTVKGGKNLR
jgi:hypothetical protein